MPLVTIDGETAKDFDDAVFAEAVEGGWRLVVAIADVAHYVKKGSALDEQALRRRPRQCCRRSLGAGVACAELRARQPGASDT